MSGNPFTLKEIPVKGAFCDREKEQSDLPRRNVPNQQWIRDDNPAKAIARACHKGGFGVVGINYYRFLC